MSDNQPRFARDVHDDHDLDAAEEPRTGAARRRRPVADWGVDDVFDHMPRRRFGHTADGPPRDRRPSSRDTRREDAYGDPVEDRFDDAREELEDRAPRPRAAAPRQEEPEIPRGGAEDGRRTIQIGSDEDVPSEIAALTADRDIGEEAPVEERPSARPHVEPGSRRTVKIDGRPEQVGFRQGPQRRRPPRSAHERIGARPERLAAYAVALGLLLILIAILTSH